MSYALYEGMKTQRLIYAVIESDAKGVKTNLSHWYFDLYSEACNFQASMQDNEKNEPDFTFVVITLIKGK